MNIQRFKDNGFGTLMSHPEGDWALFEDHLADRKSDKKEIERYKRALDFASKKAFTLGLEHCEERGFYYEAYDPIKDKLYEGLTPLEAVENAMKESE